jgi:hypothetical protein
MHPTPRGVSFEISDLVVSDVDDQRGLSWLQLSPDIIGELCRTASIEKISSRAN